MDNDFYYLDKNEIRKKYGLTDENIDFYAQVGLMEEIKKGQYKIKKKIDSMTLDKKTVFKYCFEDSWVEDMKEFAKVVKHSSPVKTFTKEEIGEMNKKIKKEHEKQTKKSVR